MRYRWFLTRDNCPICNSSEYFEIYQQRYDESPLRDYLYQFYLKENTSDIKYFHEINYTLCRCNECNAIFQLDIPNNVLMQKIYEDWIKPENISGQHQEINELDYYSYYAQEIMQIVAYFKKKPSSLDLFDYGMGWGAWALMAKAFSCNSYAFEISKRRIEYARSNGIRVISWDEISQYRFDFINTEQVFEHIPEPLQTLQYLKTALKPDGIIKISVPNSIEIHRCLKIMDWKSPKGTINSLNAVAPLEHINYFERSSIINMANKVGMEEIFIPMKLQYMYTTDWSNARKIAKNILLPFYRNVLRRQNYVFVRRRSDLSLTGV